MHRSFYHLAIGAAFACVLLGCAQLMPGSSVVDVDRELVRFVGKLDRLNNVAFPMLIAAADFCRGHTHQIYGFEVHDRRQYALSKADNAEAARRHYALDEHVTVRYVHPSLPAGTAGLRVGAVVLSIDDTALHESTADNAREIVRVVSQRREGPLHMVVQQDGAIRTFDLPPMSACQYPVVLFQDHRVNAYADGKQVIVTTGMMDFADTDTELALVLGHEIAHNTLEHIDRLRLDGLLDTIIAAHAGRRTEAPAAYTFSKEFEAEADYVGLYIAARAGYDIESGGRFWARIGRAISEPRTAAFAYSHPSTPERLAAFTNTIREIEAKKSLQKPLLPSIKSIN